MEMVQFKTGPKLVKPRLPKNKKTDQNLSVQLQAKAFYFQLKEGKP